MKPGPIFPVPQRPFDDATTSGPAALAIREDTHNSYPSYYDSTCVAKSMLPPLYIAWGATEKHFLGHWIIIGNGVCCVVRQKRLG